MGQWSYFIFSSEMWNRTSSHMCGRWYLPLFLFRDGLLTLMYRASFMALMRFWSSLPTILKSSILMLWPVMLRWSNMGEEAFWCSLNLSPKCSWGLSYIFLITIHPTTFVTVDDPTLLQHRIFVLWGHHWCSVEVLKVLTLIRWKMWKVLNC